MAYINAEQVKAIRLALKKEFPEFKFSVTKRHHSEVDVRLMSGPSFDKQKLWHRGEEVVVDLNNMDTWSTINHYHTHWYGKYEEFFNKIIEIIKTAPFKAGVGDLWFDESDSMTDYFHTAYYMSIGIGKWDKPYVAG
jgi:hypothetical protein